MPRQTQHRDTQEHFTSSIQPLQPKEQLPPTTAPASTRGLGRVQHALIAVSSPLHSGVPILEAIVHATTIFQESSSDTPTLSLLDSEDDLPSPTHYIPLLHYVSDPPLSRPDFTTLKSDNLTLLVPLPSPTRNNITQPPRQPALDFLKDKFFFTDNKQLQPQAPPLPPC